MNAFRSIAMGWVAGLTSVVLFAGVVNAQTPEGTDEVQEDWELLIQTTSPDVTAPQIATVISPIENIEAEYGVLELNHTTQPDYSDGGIQLQRWNGDFICSTRTANSHARLTTPDERITFTMTMKISGGKLAFGVINGKSQTWGDFGGEPYWRTRTDSAYPDLARYDRKVSVQKTRIGFAANLVQSFKQKTVRYYKNGELLKTDTVEQVVYDASNED